MELSNQMGRPVKFNHLECKTMLARADYLLNCAANALKHVEIPDYDKSSNKRSIQRIPHGVILVVRYSCDSRNKNDQYNKIAPWNYPFLVTINSVLPAIISGNTVILKPSPQTPVRPFIRNARYC